MPRIFVAFLLLLSALPLQAGNWPQWRGPTGIGVSDEIGMPITWDKEKNVTWKIPLPDRGNSTPILWGEQVFITQAENNGKLRSVIAFNRADGKQAWKQSVAFTGTEQTHGDNPYCASSPVTDGERVVAWHGSAGIVAYSLDGKELWKRDLGAFDMIWGNAASPIIHGDHVILSAGPGVRCLLIALNKRTGETVWSHEQTEAQGKDAKEYKGSWSTPVIHKIGGKDQILLNLPKKMCGFDPETGKLLWWCEGLTDLQYTSPLVGGGVIIAMSGFNGSAIGMKEPSATDTGDLTQSHRLWRHEKATQRVGSGVIVGPHCFIMNENGVVLCIDIKTGEQLWARGERAGTGATWSSMVFADGRLWVCNMKGETVVIKADVKFELVSVNPLNDMLRASAVFSDGQVFIRTYGHLYCIGQRKK
jgi:outer membrane protein assembly factor BamB